MAPVTLHVYDVTNQSVIGYLNQLTHDKMKLGGVFHGGIEVYGREWSFGYTADPEDSGVFWCNPAACDMHKYKQAVPLQETQMSEKEVMELVQSMSTDWKGGTYDLLGRNCCSFSNAFAEALGAGSIPKWVNAFAKIGDKSRAGAVSVYQGAEEKARAAFATPQGRAVKDGWQSFIGKATPVAAKAIEKATPAVTAAGAGISRGFDAISTRLRGNSSPPDGAAATSAAK
eukprot:Hpha_TRINITY_DN24022_c0_g1::TRINITY_DN24022_c0_g1_i1::g.130417::m.130417